MLRFKHSLSLFCVAALLSSQGLAQTVVQGETFGYVKVNITKGTGTAKRTSLISVPLLEEANISGKATGRITGVTSNTITVSGAGWTPGQLSTAATPHLLEITGGNNQGRMLLLSTSVSNTTDTVTIHSDEISRVGSLVNLITAGAGNGDTFRIRPVDTLISLFGTPSPSGVLGGTTAVSADTVVIVNNGSASTYFYKTDANPPRWSTASFPFSDASHVVVPPFAGVRYERRAATDMQLIVTGKVPSGQRRVSVKNSGPTLLSSYWPVSQTLADLAIQSTQNWLTNTNINLADTIVLINAGSSTTFYHDGSNWRSTVFGRPISDANVVPVGASVLINKRGASGGFSEYSDGVPYSLPQ